LGRDGDDAVLAEVLDALPHRGFHAVEHREHHHQRQRAEDHADEGEEGAEGVALHFLQAGADRFADDHPYSVLRASMGLSRDARMAGYIPNTSPVPAAKIMALISVDGVTMAGCLMSEVMA